MQRINLLNSLPENKPFIVPFKIVKWGVAGLLAVFFLYYIILFSMNWYTNNQVSTLENKKKALTKQLLNQVAQKQSEKGLGNLVNDVKNLKEKMAEKEKVVKIINEKKLLSLADILKFFATIKPKNLWLNTISISADENSCTIQGNSLDPTLIFTYVNKLKQIPGFKGREFIIKQLEKDKTSQIYEFVVHSKQIAAKNDKK